MGQSLLALTRLEYVTTRLMFEKLDKTAVERILGGKRDREVRAFAKHA